jgi:tRNA pseudouridine38-40 synthase
MPVQRFKLTISYRGTRYHGWQQQPALESYTGPAPIEGQGIPTIQEIVSRAIGAVVGHPITLFGSSRTDAGVHAKAQLAHFDTTQITIPTEGVRRAVNHKLPGDILITTAERVTETFHALHSATRKRYQYSIWNSHDRPVFFNDLAWHRWQELDTRAMIEAAAHLVGEKDFTSFARPGHGRESAVRTVFACNVQARAPRIVIGIEGSGFLWNMVRIMVGTLVQVGMGNFTPGDIPRMLEAKDRSATGPTAPPHGLYLQWIQHVPVEPVEEPDLSEPASRG